MSGEPGSAGNVFWRGIGAGAAIGTGCGALTPAWIMLTGCCLHGLDGLDQLGAATVLCLVAAPFGAFVGVVVGVVCALIPAALLAEHAEYYRGHPEAARACAMSVLALLTVATMAVAARASYYNVLDGLWTAVPPLAGMVLGARTVPKVLYGQASDLVSGRRYSG